MLIWEVAFSSWQRWWPAHEGFEHVLWGDENLTECMREAFPEHLAGFIKLPGGIERADVGRYCVMHRFGGMYADLDYEARINFYKELPRGLASLLECRSKDLGVEVENSLMASPPGHPLWRRAMERTFSVPGSHRWDEARGGTGPRMLTALLAEAGGADAAGVHVLPCKDFHRGVAADSGAAHCGSVADAGAARQRGIHWSTTSHTSFVGAALRAEVFYGLHPELRGRRLLRERFAQRVAVRSAGSPPAAPRSARKAAELLAACLGAASGIR